MKNWCLLIILSFSLMNDAAEYVFYVIHELHSAPAALRHTLQAISEVSIGAKKTIAVLCAGQDKSLNSVMDEVRNRGIVVTHEVAKNGLFSLLYHNIHALADSCKVIVLPTSLNNSSQTIADVLRTHGNDVWLAVNTDGGFPHVFYAGLFKRVPLDALVQLGKLNQEINSYESPMKKLAGDHAREFGNNKPIEVPYRGYRLNPLETWKALKTSKRTTIVCYSKDRPMQLYAFLESCKRFLEGRYDIVIIYATSHGEYKKGYDSVARVFSGAQWVHQADLSLKTLTLEAVFNNSGDYVMFAVDDIVVKDTINLKKCMDILEDTGAYGFYLRLGKNITYCYSMNSAVKLPPLTEISDGVYAWQFNRGRGDWKHAPSLDMSLWRKADVKSFLEKLDFATPNQLEAVWEGHVNYSRIGLCFETSKIVNIPLNLVQSYAPKNRNMNLFSAKDLLGYFNRGFKIDINGIINTFNNAPHMDHKPRFIKR